MAPPKRKVGLFSAVQALLYLRSGGASTLILKIAGKPSRGIGPDNQKGSPRRGPRTHGFHDEDDYGSQRVLTVADSLEGKDVIPGFSLGVSGLSEDSECWRALTDLTLLVVSRTLLPSLRASSLDCESGYSGRYSFL